MKLMQTIFRKIFKGIRILWWRLRNQGLLTTLKWLYGRGIPKLTGVPLVAYSKITPHIYIGPQYGKYGKTRLQRLGVDHSVNLRVEFDDAQAGLAMGNYCYLPTTDDAAPTIEHLERAAEFIAEAVEADKPVYIHCAGGVGRAPTAAAAYFISTGMSVDEALALIISKRPFIKVMPEQLEGLRAFEQHIRQKQVAVVT